MFLYLSALVFLFVFLSCMAKPALRLIPCTFATLTLTLKKSVLNLDYWGTKPQRPNTVLFRLCGSMCAYILTVNLNTNWKIGFTKFRTFITSMS